MLSACGAVDQTGTDTTDSAQVDVTKTPAYCTANQVLVIADTDKSTYRPGQTVHISSLIVNRSSHACTLGVGPLAGVSPLVSVNDSAGDQMWSNCFVNDEHGACYTFWNYQTLAGGGVFERDFTWDQGTNMPADGAVSRIPDGTYSLITSYASVGAHSDPVTITISD